MAIEIDWILMTDAQRKKYNKEKSSPSEKKSQSIWKRMFYIWSKEEWFCLLVGKVVEDLWEELVCEVHKNDSIETFKRTFPRHRIRYERRQ